MAPKKQVPETLKKPSRVRFVVFEAELNEGESIADVTNLLTHALRPTAPPQSRIISNGKPAGQLLPPAESPEAEPEDEETFIDGDAINAANEEQVTTPKTALKQPRPKTYKNPDFVELEWNGTGNPPVSLKDFAAQKAPKTKARKYLVAAYWLKEHAERPNVNIDTIYSCFKTAGWSVGFRDWRQTFDNLVHSDHMRKVGTGEFTITTLGEGTLQTPES